MVRGGHIVKSQDVCLQEVRIRTRRNGSPIKNVHVKDNGDMKVACTPPSFQNQLMYVSNNITATPPTPHRIELRDVPEFQQNQPPADLVIQPKDIPPPPKAKRKLGRKKVTKVEQNTHKLTEFFSIRRSVRKTKSTVLEEQQRYLENTLRNNIEEGLEVCHFEEKGRGIVAAREFSKGDFVVEYSGELIDIPEAKRREKIYAQDQNAGCYMYYFKHKGQQYCVDATEETGKYGRLVNHSRNGNLLTRTISVDGVPRLILVAKHHIQVGEELTYDYGDRSKESLQHHPWLAF